MAKRASIRTTLPKVKSTHDAVETAIDLSKKGIRGTWEGSARKLRMGIATWEFGGSRTPSGPSEIFRDK